MILWRTRTGKCVYYSENGVVKAPGYATLLTEEQFKLLKRDKIIPEDAMYIPIS